MLLFGVLVLINALVVPKKEKDKQSLFTGEVNSLEKWRVVRRIHFYLKTHPHSSYTAKGDAFRWLLIGLDRPRFHSAWRKGE